MGLHPFRVALCGRCVASHPNQLSDVVRDASTQRIRAEVATPFRRRPEQDEASQTRRVHRRHDARLQARYALALGQKLGAEHACQCRNLSLGGCMLTTGDGVLRFSHVAVQVGLPGGWVRVAGTVMWSKPPRRDALGAILEAGTIGIAFTEQVPRPLATYLDDCGRRSHEA
jgi:hypothetical protein